MFPPYPDPFSTERRGGLERFSPQMELYELTVKELKEKIRKKEISVQEVVKSYYQRIEQVEEKIHSFITLTKKEALEQAKRIDEKIKNGEMLGELAGIPIAIKDNICIKGVKTTCGSKILENYVAPYDATVIKKLKDADAIFLGKTNMDEFAMGSSTETSYFGVTLNPHNLEYIPGGSSGGSASAVAAKEAPFALGSDTGGSIRQPASCCGIVGLKPTYGRVSRYGLVAFASSLDQIGPLVRNVYDCALLLKIISGYDIKDSTSVDLPVPDYCQGLQGLQGLKGLRVGLPKEYFIEGIDQEVEKAVKEAAKILEKLGAEIVEVSLPHTEYAVATYYIIAPSEASANLARYDGVRYGYRSPSHLHPAPKNGAGQARSSNLIEAYERTRGEGFGAEVKRRIMLGTYALSAGYYDAYYLKALKVRTLIRNDFDEAFKKVDVILSPTAPTPAFKLGEKLDDPLKMYLSDIFTISANLAGIPGINIPCRYSKDKLPIGLQILGKPFAEETILQVAHLYEITK